jgi:hypothetical protein
VHVTRQLIYGYGCEDAILDILRQQEDDAESRQLLEEMRGAWEACYHKSMNLEAAAMSDPESCVSQLAGLHRSS